MSSAFYVRYPDRLALMKHASEIFAARLLEALEAAGSNKRDFAKKLGRHETTIGKWVKGGTEPSLDDLARIADALGLSIDWLLGRDPAGATPALADGALPAGDVRYVDRQLAVIRAAIDRVEQKTGRKK